MYDLQRNSSRTSTATANLSWHWVQAKTSWRALAPAILPSGKPDPGLIRLEDGQLDDGIAQFIEAIAKHRHFARETDPPLV